MIKTSKTLRINPDYKSDNLNFIDENRDVVELFADNLKHIKDFTAIHNLSQLEYLSLCNNTNITDLHFLGVKPVLKKLVLNNTSVLNLMGIQDCSLIEELALQHCLKLNSISGIELLKNLIRVDLSFCYELKSIDELSLLPNLKAINVRGCRSLLENLKNGQNYSELSSKFRFN
jgi:hypothetical protein